MARTPGSCSGTGTAGTAARLVAAAVAALLALTACTGGDGDDGPVEPEEAALRLQVVYGDGDLDEPSRIAVETEVGDVLSRYLAGAFLGDYPRQDFLTAFGDFTPRAARDAATDIEVLTGTGFADASAVRASDLRARLALFAPPDGVLGATANVVFRFEVTQDGATSTATLRGRLMLTRERGAWSVFGYDVALDDGGAVEAAVS